MQRLSKQALCLQGTCTSNNPHSLTSQHDSDTSDNEERKGSPITPLTRGERKRKGMLFPA
eukprot:9002692-Ditylum_brightwellii.AAC.1